MNSRAHQHSIHETRKNIYFSGTTLKQSATERYVAHGCEVTYREGGMYSGADGCHLKWHGSSSSDSPCPIRACCGREHEEDTTIGFFQE